MLTNSDLKLNFINFRLCSLLSVYPIHFRSSGDIATKENVWWRKLLFKFWQGLTSCHLSYMILRTAYAALFNNPNWEILALIIFLILCFGTFVCFMFMFFETNLGLNLKLFNEILNIRDELATSRVRGKITPVEFVLCHSFTLLASGLIIYPMLYILDMDAMYLIISVVPTNWRSPGVILFCLTMEIIPHLIYLLWLNYTLYMILSFILTFEQYTQWNISKLGELENSYSNSISSSPDEEPVSNPEFGMEMKSLVKKGGANKIIVIASKIEKFHRALHRLNLYLKFFELGGSKALFQAKQLCLTISIGGGFLAIKLVRRRPELALMYLLLHIYSMTFHTAIFSLAYGVTIKGEELKRGLLLTSKLERGVKAVSKFGVSVGGFYHTERESVLIFMHFVVHQIVGLLVSF